MSRSVSQTTRLWLRLSLIPKRSPAFWLALLEHFQLSLQQLFTLPPEELKQCGLTAGDIPHFVNEDDSVIKIFKWLEEAKVNQLVSLEDENYPQRLRHLDSPPLILYCQGNAELLPRSQVGIVGSRRATIHGLNNARRFGRELGLAGITVTSGLALGIDGAAHEGAYATAGGTIAILGGGLNEIYPRNHTRLARSIVEHQGCLVSEFLPWEKVRPYHFPRRNRLIAAMSKGVLLIEARIKSGSMITANLAAELGTDVFAMPGNISSPLSEGPHFLIRQGAALITSVDDILCELGWGNITKPEDDYELRQEQQQDPILAELTGEAVTIDYLAVKTGMPVSVLMPRILDLELNGIVAAVPGGYALAVRNSEKR